MNEDCNPHTSENPKRKRKYTEEQRRRRAAQLAEWKKKNADRYLASIVEWRKKNKELCFKAQNKWKQANPECSKEVNRKWRAANKEKISNYSRNKYKVDPVWRLRLSLRNRVNNAIGAHGARKFAATQKLTGCTTPQLIRHLEKQFQKGMTWVNRGRVWHIDHIVPCAAFDLTTDEGQRACFHFSNLRPLFAAENLSKHAKIITCQPELPISLV